MIEKDYTLMSADTTESRDILGRLVREWSERFALGQAKYSEVEHLGPAGVFPDVNRKVGRIKRDIWEVMPIPDGAEDTREVILDVIGHLFLMLYLYDEERKAKIGPRSKTGLPGEYIAKRMLDALEPPEGTTKMSLHTAPPGGRGNLPDGGWYEMPEEVKAALRAIADGDEVVSTPQLRRVVSEYFGHWED